VARVSEGYREAFFELRQDPCHQEPMYAGALETVAELAARPNVLLGVATGKSRRGVAALFERFGIGDHFVTIQTADTHPSKPHPSMILKGIAERGGEPGRTVMIGDSDIEHDMVDA